MQEETLPKETFALDHWNKLSRLHCADVCDRTGAHEHPPSKGFLLPVYNLRYLILPEERKILRMDQKENFVDEELHSFFTLMVLVYLTEAKKESRPSNIWVSDKELKAGFTFFRGPHSLQVKDLEERYGNDPGAFLKAGEKLGGREISFGNKAFALDVLPKIPIAYILWEGSEEFPARVNVLFDSTIQAHLPLDVIWGMVAETSRRLAG